MRSIVGKMSLVAGICALAITAFALPPLPPYIEEYYAADPEHAKYLSMYRGLEGEHKCDACHRPGIDKKVKGHGLNDYGQVVHKHFKHRDFNKADKLGKENAEEKAKARQLLADALSKADQEKNSDGVVYGDLIKAGKLPGKN